MKVGVIGLGYTGAVCAACLARDGHEVVGVDTDPSKLELLHLGQAPVVEEGLQDVVRAAVESKRLALGDTIDRRIAECDVTLVCVGTPAGSGEQYLAAVHRIAEQLGAVLGDASHFPVIVLRSTVPPGTTDSAFTTRLEEACGLKAGVDFGVCFQPEFLREGSSIHDFYHPPFTIVGSASERAVERVKELFAQQPGEFVHTDTRTAEMIKLVCNAFHALKVSFANEIGRIAQSLDIDARTVMEIVCKDSSLNISPAYLRPGFAYGGSCLPKDLRALLHLARRRDVETPVIQAIAPSNHVHIERAAALIMARGSRNVGMIGLSFKPGTDDLRESPLVTLAEQLIGKGYQLRIFDPAVTLSRLLGANKAYVERSLPHIASLLCTDLVDVLLHADVLVIGHRSREVTDALAYLKKPGLSVVDLVGMSRAKDLQCGYRGICW
ncbi:MAG TPA: nucleotide sugar dehydrogenase [Steroidobacteraceae bacterium]|nr:nucleotide sugar dehydrogenase [Steroidobacteraceae bacterium]